MGREVTEESREKRRRLLRLAEAGRENATFPAFHQPWPLLGPSEAADGV